MNDTPATPIPVQAERTTLLVACATAIILAALAAGGYLLWQELQRMANTKPEAPVEVTQALTELRTQLDQQRSDNASQLQALQNDIVALKEQQAAQVAPDMDATLAPVQEKLDAIAAQLQEAPPVVQVEEIAPQETAAPEVNAQNALRDYLALRRAVEAGRPYAAELAALIPQLPDSELAAITTLQAYAEHGIGEEDAEAEAPTGTLKPWMASINDRLKGLVSIKPAAETQATPQARAEITAALDRIEASLMGGQ